jgi:hypothetical protein
VYDAKNSEPDGGNVEAFWRNGLERKLSQGAASR